MKNYRKAAVAVAGFLTVLAGALSDGAVSQEEGAALLVAAATALGVFFFKNEQPES